MANDGPLGTAFTTLVDGVAEVGKTATEGLRKLSSPETQKWRQKELQRQKNYQYKRLMYPLNLGQDGRHPYYMTFYINDQDLSKYKVRPSNGPAPLSTAEINARSSRTLAKNIRGSKIGFGRKTHRTSTAIRLFMPDTLSWSYANSFKDVSLSGVFGAALAQGITTVAPLATSMAEGFTRGGITGLLASLDSPNGRAAGGPLLEMAGELVPGLGRDAALSAVGVAINPQIDVIYDSPHLREFAFDFLFAPRSEEEAAMVQEIIRAFKFHAAPEILDSGGGVGRYFVPPSEFDIEFSVDTMGKISTCVLQNMTVDYASSGTAFYKNDQPVYTRITLQFKELEFITKNLIAEGDY